jgi:hypothetical protein
MSKSRWCIVVADDHGADVPSGVGRDLAPVQYSRLGPSATPWQKALNRAAAVAPISQVMVTAFAENRRHWESALWFVRPERRFIAATRSAAAQSLAAAILDVAARSPSNVITIIPARCHVEHEEILRRAITNALRELPATSEGAVTLGMLDIEDSIDEDYLVVTRPPVGRGLLVDGYARRPVPWVARHLKHNGALVSSGIIVGYAGALAAHISRVWPGATRSLLGLAHAAEAVGEECLIQVPAARSPSAAPSHLLRWHPPAFPQRVFGVYKSGWSGLHTPRSVARTLGFLSSCMDEEPLEEVVPGFPPPRAAGVLMQQDQP